MKKIFLTGASSYLGSRFIQLYSDSFEIDGLSRSDSSKPCDLNDFAEVTKRFEAFKPDIVIHFAADTGRDSMTIDSITQTNPGITKHLVELAKSRNLPFLFSSTEAVYGGKEETGDYTENDSLKPRSPYGLSKVLSEKIIIESGIPYLITRGHRYVGRNLNYSRPKQFPDAMKSLLEGEILHLDSRKLFSPVHIGHICEIYLHHINHHLDEKIIINIGTPIQTTFYQFISDVAKGLDIDQGFVQPDGLEEKWPQNSALCMDKMQALGFPTLDYEDLVQRIILEYKKD